MYMYIKISIDVYMYADSHLAVLSEVESQGAQSAILSNTQGKEVAAAPTLGQGEEGRQQSQWSRKSKKGLLRARC